jgi:DNA-binding transcriptional regulator WhiA
MRIIYSWLAAAVMAAGLWGCNTQPKKMPCTDVDIQTKFEREIYILKNTDLPTESEAKFRAARILYQNVDFTFARDTNTLVSIFGARDARRGTVLDNHAIVYQYVWNNEYIRFAFMGVGSVITGCEIKMDKYQNSKP